MNIRTLIIRTFRHYWRSNLVASLGIAITTAVLCGGLIVGDSLRYSLLKQVEVRLGNTTHAMTSGERVFTASLAERLEASTGFPSAPVLLSRAVVTVPEGGQSLNRVQLLGIDRRFCSLALMPDSVLPGPGEAVVSANVAERLMGWHPEKGSYSLDSLDLIELQLSISHVGQLPANTPFVTDDKQVVQASVVVKAVAPAVSYGLFNLHASQTAPFTLFVNREWLNEQLESKGLANVLLVNTASEATDVEALKKSIREVAAPEDLSLITRKGAASGSALLHPATEQYESLVLASSRVFIDDNTAASLLSNFPESSPSITYFVNSLAFGGRETPYSFVTTSSGGNGQPWLKADEIVVSTWLAADLDVSPGDTLNMRYFVFGSLKTLTEKERRFVVKSILPVSTFARDSVLMPFLPGLTDAGNCSEWKAGIPIDLKKIRDKDEAYWDQFKGTPKAYISLETGIELWQNAFGTFTSIVLNQTANRLDSLEGTGRNHSTSPVSSSSTPAAAGNSMLSGKLDPFVTDFRVSPVLQEGLDAAGSGVDFSQLFLGLGMFILVSGLLLTVLLFKLSLKRRDEQIRLLKALGFSEKLINRIVLWEIAAIALPGTFLGVLLSVGYSKLVFWGLEGLWFDIVRTEVLILHINPLNVLVGAMLGYLFGLVTVYLSVRKLLSRPRTGEHQRFVSSKFFQYLGIGRLLSVLLAAGCLTYLLFAGKYTDTGAWFLAGMLLLLACLFVVSRFLFAPEKPKDSATIRLSSLGLRNLRRNPWGSFSTILLLVLSSFLLIVTAANKKGTLDDASDKTSGTGGFDYVVEATVPMLYDLNAPERRKAFTLPSGLQFVQLLSAYDDDASCLNINKVAQPRLLGVNPDELEGRFTFVSTGLIQDKNHPWKTLDVDMNGLIPAIVDETVMVWGLGKKVGDTLTYVNKKGEKIGLLLVGGLASSVFQGHVLISRTQFERNFPEAGGSDFLLVTNSSQIPNVPEQLDFTFKEYGWQITSTLDKLAEFASIENTYLNIFFMMGAFAMLLAIAGLAVSVFSNLLERRQEWALLLSMGFKRTHLLRLFAYEHLSLFAVGTLIGLLCSVVSTLPSLISGDATVSVGYIALVLLVLVLNGLLWLTLTPLLFFVQLPAWKVLRNE